jgi:hypothetical protein
MNASLKNSSMMDKTMALGKDAVGLTFRKVWKGSTHL